MATGQCKVNPVTGISGDIYTAWTGDADAGLAADATTSGSTIRKLFAAGIESIAASINNSGGGSAIYGAGTDGTMAFNGTDAVTGFTRSGTTYTCDRSVFPTNATISAGVTVKMSSAGGTWQMFGTGTLTVEATGVIHWDGAAASGAGGGAAGGDGTLRGGGSGAGGGAGAGTDGSDTSPSVASAGGAGGAGSGGAGGAGGTVTAPNETTQGGVYHFYVAQTTRLIDSTPLVGGGGGGAGGGDGAAGNGGGGGAGGAVGVLWFKTISNSGTIRAHGGAGAAGTGNNCGGGGGGSGGHLYLGYNTYSGNAATVSGGAGGASGGGAGVAGSAGTAGRLTTIANQ